MYPSFESIKWLYDIEVYKALEIKVYVGLGCLTEEQYESIVGEPYPEPQAE